MLSWVSRTDVPGGLAESTTATPTSTDALAGFVTAPSLRAVLSTFAMPLDERREVIQKIRMWAEKPHLKVHQIIALVVHGPAALPRQQLARLIETKTGSANGYGAVANLLTPNGNTYGRVFIDCDGRIDLHPDVRVEVHRYTWS